MKANVVEGIDEIAAVLSKVQTKLGYDVELIVWPEGSAELMDSDETMTVAKWSSFPDMIAGLEALAA